jgi:uncharacterized protein YggE
MISITSLRNGFGGLGWSTAVALIAFAVPAAGSAQISPPTQPAPPPQIITQGRGEVDVIPDRGELIVQVETRAVDGGQAGAANAAAIAAVLDTLKRGFRLVDRDLATIGYNLHPQMVYPGDGKAPRVVGFVATNSIRVRTEQVARIGAMIDAAITKGATGVAGLTFYAANVDDARRRALAMARLWQLRLAADSALSSRCRVNRLRCTSRYRVR